MDEDDLVLRPDEDLVNADWIKQSWDIPEINSVEKLRKYLKERGITVEHFKSLPVYKNSVKVHTWMAEL